MTASFNLIHEPWVPCLVAGEPAPRDLSLRETLARAPDIIEIADPSPLVTVALHRLLLAILHRVFGPPTHGDWQTLWEAGAFDMDRVDAYLASWEHRFDLFDNERPFYQTPALPGESATTVLKLGHEFSAGNNAVLFDHSWDAAPVVISAPMAARLVIAHQAFAIGGLIGRLPGEPPSAEASHLVKAAVTLTTGDNLRETLVLNMVQVDGRQGAPFEFNPRDDLPAWERGLPVAQPRQPDGYLDLLTWQSRRIRLIPGADGQVSRMVLMEAFRFPPGYTVRGRETMVSYRTLRDAPRNQEPWSPIGFRPERALWRDTALLFGSDESASLRAPVLSWLSGLTQAGYLPEGRAFELTAFGMSSDRSKVFLWRQERLPLTPDYLSDPGMLGALRDGIRGAEDGADALRRAVRYAASEALGPGGSADPARTAGLLAALAPERGYWPALDLPFRTFIRRLASDFPSDQGTAARLEWADAVGEAARDAFERAGRALETTGRGYRAVAAGRRLFRSRLKQALAGLQPDLEESTP